MFMLKFQSGNGTYHDYGYDNQPKCGYNNQSLVLSNKFLSNIDGIFDCTFSVSSRTNFIDTNQRRDYQQASHVINANIYETRSRRRNMLGLVDDLQDSSYEYETGNCEPYLISLDITNTTILDYDNTNYSLDVNSSFPFCGFWDTDNSTWIDHGCYVYSYNSSNVICACTHLTSFQLSAKDFVPKANLLTVHTFREVTIENLLKYPTTWIVIVSLFIIFVSICIINPKNEKQNKLSIIAYEDIIFQDFKNSMMKSDVIGKEIKYIDDLLPNKEYLGEGILKLFGDNREDKRSLCRLHYHLYKIYLRNDHTLLSMFQRTAGTNFSTKQRIACFYMYLVSIIAATAVFYGVEHKVTQDITASFFTSLFAKLPVFLIKKFFKDSKPKPIERTIIPEQHEEIFKQRTLTIRSRSTQRTKGGEEEDEMIRIRQNSIIRTY